MEISNTEKRLIAIMTDNVYLSMVRNFSFPATLQVVRRGLIFELALILPVENPEECSLNGTMRGGEVVLMRSNCPEVHNSAMVRREAHMSCGTVV
jgi:hypothetical protein